MRTCRRQGGQSYASTEILDTQPRRSWCAPLAEQERLKLSADSCSRASCPLCELHQGPTGVPVSSMPRNSVFNQRVQADALWIQVPGQRHQQPVLMISDSTTRLLAARHLRGGERTEEFTKQLVGAGSDTFWSHADLAGGRAPSMELRSDEGMVHRARHHAASEPRPGTHPPRHP